MKLLTGLFLLVATSLFGAVPSYTVFRGTGGILVMSNPPTGNITIDGSGIFTTSGTNATIAVSTNGVLVMVAATNINFIRGSNVFLAATNIGSTAHIAINAFTPVPFIEGAVTNLLLTWILPVLTVDNATITNLGASPPISSVQYNSNNITRGSARFVFTNGPSPQVGIGTGIPAAGSTLDVTGHIYAADAIVTNIVVAGQGVEVTAGSFVLNGGTTALVAWNGLGRIRWDADGVMRLENDAANSFNRINFRDNTAASPALGITNGDFIILGGNGNFKVGGSTNRLIVPAVHIANDGAMGTSLLRLDNPLNGLKWDLAINSHAETSLLGLGFNDGNYAMVWELGGNVGISTTNPTTTLDVQGRFTSRSNVYFPNIASNALPVALLATDSGGEVYETAIPTVSASPETNAVLTNLVGTVARNVTNFVSLSTSNATSKPLTNSYAAGVVTVFGIEAGANVTAIPNGSNIVVAGGTLLNNFFAMGVSNIVAASSGIVVRTNNGSLTLSNSQSGEITVSGHSNAIPFINGAGNAFRYIETTGGFGSLTNPGFGFNPISGTGPQGGYAGLMVFANESHGLLTIGHPNPGSDFSTFATAFAVSNRYNGSGFKQIMSRYDAVDVGSGSDPSSTFVSYFTWSGSVSNLAAEIRKDGRMTLLGGTLYPTNSATLPTAAELGVGGYWIGSSNNAAGGATNALVMIFSLDGSTTKMKMLAP